MKLHFILINQFAKKKFSNSYTINCKLYPCMSIYAVFLCVQILSVCDWCKVHGALFKEFNKKGISVMFSLRHPALVPSKIIYDSMLDVLAASSSVDKATVIFGRREFVDYTFCHLVLN